MSGRVKRVHHAKHGEKMEREGRGKGGTERSHLLLTHIHSSMIIALIIILFAGPDAGTVGRK